MCLGQRPIEIDEITDAHSHDVDRRRYMNLAPYARYSRRNERAAWMFRMQMLRSYSEMLTNVDGDLRFMCRIEVINLHPL